MSENQDENEVPPVEPDPKQDGKTTAELGLVGEARQRWWEAVFWKLTESPRFVKFLEENYVIGMQKMEDGGNPLDPIVREKPEPKRQLPADVIFKMGMALMQSGARDSTALLKRLLQIMDAEAPMVMPANEADMLKMANQTDLKKKLD